MQNRYVNYYAQEGRLIPAQVHVRDLTQLFATRRALFMQLGLPPGLLAGKSVLEIGPAQGAHARYILEQRPASYTFLEANPFCTPTLQQIAQSYAAHTRCEIITELFESRQWSQQYDVVWCERTIECQQDPKGFLAQVLPLVAPGGILLLTTIDTLSAFPDFLRYLAAKRLVDAQSPYAQQCQRLAALFGPHLQTLSGLKKPVINWVEENLMFPLCDKKFISQRDVLEVVGGQFQVTGTAPQILKDWRWYQNITDTPAQANERIAKLLSKQAHNLLDYRCHYPAMEHVEQLYRLSEQIMKLIEQHDVQGDAQLLPIILNALEEMIHFYAPLDGPTAQSLQDFSQALPLLSPTTERLEMGLFSSMFGRGVQHMLLTRVTV
ncbi:Methyltransferase type 12 [Magnetococcus marinus MC-1]|uniref:Methyltransferase type 12 n=1 Tax=Magnetococcus marinus (strain ATCC BAA-1437 / JCM 17883 / MC-1) TaxID=156889 RepID=A0LC43_MAGMM|nr:class I SAM-dependent methyltransferase [Magnetococcus marinus]ABK45536.1 Methyltransferase type 12 [Magnetococcus marinus MC-1]